MFDVGEGVWVHLNHASPPLLDTVTMKRTAPGNSKAKQYGGEVVSSWKLVVKHHFCRRTVAINGHGR
jgi:hypothetical protein